MNTVRLGDICSKIGSGATPRGGSSVYIDQGIALIRSQNVYNDGFTKAGLAYINEEHGEQLSGVEVLADDVLLNITGDSVARACRAPAGVMPARVNQHVAIIRPDPELLDARYLHFYLVSPRMQAWMLSLAGAGATRNALTKGMIEDFEIPCPPIDEQRAIASVLGSLDDKIELNRRMNRTLEQMATAIFKAWFVDFEPVRAKASGAASFPGMPQPVFDSLPATFADSELGPIPEGWEVKTFGDLLDLPYGKALKADNRRAGVVPVYGSNGPVGWHDESLVKGPGIIVGRKGNPGTVEWCETDFFPIDTTFYVKTKSNAPSLRLLYYQLKTADLARLSADSAVPGVNRNAVYGDPCISPPSEFTGWFDEAVAPLWSLMLSNSEEIRTLAETRDALLPKLLSGEVRIDGLAAGTEVASCA